MLINAYPRFPLFLLYFRCKWGHFCMEMFPWCVYSPGPGAYIPQGTKFWCQQKLLVTSVICCKFRIIDDNSFWKIHCFTFFPYKSIRDQILPCRNIGQGQPRIIMWINLVVLEHPMLHTKFQSHRPFVSGEEDFLMFLPYMGMAAILGKWPGPF